jgi:O-Antigen ligase
VLRFSAVACASAGRPSFDPNTLTLLLKPGSSATCETRKKAGISPNRGYSAMGRMEQTLGHLERAPTTVGWRPRRDDLLVFGSAGAVAMASAALVAFGYGLPLIAAVVGLAGVAVVFARPDLVVLGWVALLLADGRDFTHLHAGPLYVSELLLTGVLASFGLRWLFSGRVPSGSRFALTLSALLLAAAVCGLLLYTRLGEGLWMQEFAIVHYSLIGAIGAWVITRPEFPKRLLYALLIGSTLALVLTYIGFAAGNVNITSTGALRIAPVQYSVAFAVTPLVIVALVRERLLRPIAILAAVPFLVALLLVNHRSAWIAFAAALALLLASRPTASARLALLAGVMVGILFLATAYVVSPDSLIGDAVARGGSITETEDPNAEYRLEFWESIARVAVRSPVGAGFDPYPEEWVPKNTVVGEEKHPAPHNSWLALLYRVGPIILLIVVAGLIGLVLRAFREARFESDPARRAQLAALASSLVFVAIIGAFNVVLELPYLAILFWLLVGFLAQTVASRPDPDPETA